MEVEAIPYRAYLITKDISLLDNSGVEVEDSIADDEIYDILDLKLDNHRNRNTRGEPYRSLRFGRMKVTLDASQHQSHKVFYDAMESETPMSFTRIYGVRHDGNKFTKLENSMSYDVYVTNIEEYYDVNSSEQMKLNIEFLCVDNKIRIEKSL